jgi:small subunit ribosomal protein S17
MAEETKEEVTTTSADEQPAETAESGQTPAQAAADATAQASDATGAAVAGQRGRRAEKIGVVSSDKMEKTCVVRVDRLVKHPKYRRYVRRTSKFMAHNEQGATTGDKVRIVETRPLSANKRWRVVEIIQKAEK